MHFDGGIFAIENDYVTPTNCLYLKSVNCLLWPPRELSTLLHWNLLSKLSSLTQFSVRVSYREDLFRVDEMMEHLKLATPSVRYLYLDCTDFSGPEESCVEFLVQAKAFIKKHQNNKLVIEFDISFYDIPIQTQWNIHSKWPSSLPLDIAYPKHAKDIESTAQWCSSPDIKGLSLESTSTAILKNTEMTPFLKVSNGTILNMVLKHFSTDYVLHLNGFDSLDRLEIKFSTLNKFPSLPESLKKLRIEYVTDLAMTDMDHGIVLPTQLCSLTWTGNKCCYTLPKILNVDELHDLKDVSINICPFEFSDLVDDSLCAFKDSVSTHALRISNLDTTNFLRISNTCTIDQLQQSVSQLPYDLQSFQISIDGYIRSSLNDYSACCLDNLSFEHFTNLNYLELSCLNNDSSFNVSVFPNVEHLNVNISPPVFSGSFAPGIRSLTVSLKTYREPLSHFMNHFISKLISLVSLSIKIYSHTHVDIRKFTFPSHLCSFILKLSDYFQWDNNPIIPVPINNVNKGCVIVDAFPIRLNYFELGLPIPRTINVIVDDRKGENVSSMAKRISFSLGKANWIQYSHFDCDEETLGIDSLYIS
ncbi:unnamed protein product [Ambrosiozyma monospora]|uniref:Unnamed protein product n=1 Tax=Ambrosiozyma monospora TaxID=43982 RepID=A0ACB5SSG1_AMBMO|nr:unnamed protein product [Ambrosiozyma monospora]